MSDYINDTQLARLRALPVNVRVHGEEVIKQQLDD